MTGWVGGTATLRSLGKVRRGEDRPFRSPAGGNGRGELRLNDRGHRCRLQSHAFGFRLECCVLHHRESRAERISDPASPLLQDVGQLVSQESLALGDGGVIVSRPEIEVGSVREGQSPDRRHLVPDVHADVGEVRAEEGFHLPLHGLGQALPGAAGPQGEPRWQRERTLARWRNGTPRQDRPGCRGGADRRQTSGSRRPGPTRGWGRRSRDGRGGRTGEPGLASDEGALDHPGTNAKGGGQGRVSRGRVHRFTLGPGRFGSKRDAIDPVADSRPSVEFLGQEIPESRALIQLLGDRHPCWLYARLVEIP